MVEETDQVCSMTNPCMKEKSQTKYNRSVISNDDIVSSNGEVSNNVSHVKIEFGNGSADKKEVQIVHNYL